MRPEQILAVLIKIAMNYGLNYTHSNNETPESLLDGFQHYVNENLHSITVKRFLKQLNI